MIPINMWLNKGTPSIKFMDLNGNGLEVLLSNGTIKWLEQALIVAKDLNNKRKENSHARHMHVSKR